MERILDVLKNQKITKDDTYVHLLDSLCWDFSNEDHELLDRLEIFDALLKGNGDLVHPLRSAWGGEDSFYKLNLSKTHNF